jgi:hypothetical protein
MWGGRVPPSGRTEFRQPAGVPNGAQIIRCPYVDRLGARLCWRLTRAQDNSGKCTHNSTAELDTDAFADL